MVPALCNYPMTKASVATGTDVVGPANYPGGVSRLVTDPWPEQKLPAPLPEVSTGEVDEPELGLDCPYCGHELDMDGFCSYCGATALTRPEPR